MQKEKRDRQIDKRGREGQRGKKYERTMKDVRMCSRIRSSDFSLKMKRKNYSGRRANQRKERKRDVMHAHVFVEE